jgi:hypothetical protein
MLAHGIYARARGAWRLPRRRLAWPSCQAAAKRAMLPLALSGLVVASRLRSDSATAVQQGRGGSDIERPLGGTRWDATAHGGRCTGGHCRGVRKRATTQLNNGNRGSDASEHAAGEGILGKTAPTCGTAQRCGLLLVARLTHGACLEATVGREAGADWLHGKQGRMVL